MTLAEELSHYVYSLKYSDIPDNIVHESKKRIIDALGCGIGAFNAEPVKFSRKIAESAEVNMDQLFSEPEGRARLTWLLLSMA